MSFVNPILNFILQFTFYDCFHFNVDICTKVVLLPIPDPNKPEEHEPWCPLSLVALFCKLVLLRKNIFVTLINNTCSNKRECLVY